MNLKAVPISRVNISIMFDHFTNAKKDTLFFKTAKHVVGLPCLLYLKLEELKHNHKLCGKYQATIPMTSRLGQQIQAKRLGTLFCFKL